VLTLGLNRIPTGVEIMRERRDPEDDRQTGDDVPNNRDHSDDTETDPNQPQPSETGADMSGDHAGSETPPQSDNHQQQPNPQENPADAITGSETSTEQDRDRVTRSATYPESETEVEITEQARSDEDWVDLGGYPYSGEALAAGDLTPEKRREYTTDTRSLASLVQVHWGIRVTLGALIVGLIATWGLGRLGFDPQWGGAVVVVLVLAGLAWVALHYRKWTYQIRADAIYLERGVVTHVRTLVPYVRIQHVDTSRSPIERTLGLSTLVVYTAGSRGADVSIPGLRPDEARDLQRRVKELAIEAKGDDAL
jgi:membrane protein YdbS with pleckstrin-like domain